MLNTGNHSASCSPDASETGVDYNTNDALTIKLETLAEMPYDALRVEWRRLYRANPPRRVSRDLLKMGVGWKLQEQALGGLSAATKRRLSDLAKAMERDGDVTRDRVARLKPGATLVREWHGEEHTVVVTEDGFEWRGLHWRSLSAIAREITGVRWSGPRFFGLNRKTGGRSDAAMEGATDA